jgi:hypothetical protein
LLTALAPVAPAIDASGGAAERLIVVAQAPKLVSSTSVNGRTIRVFVVGNCSPVVNVQQINDHAMLKVGTHTIAVSSDGRISVDGNENSYGQFHELDVTFGADDSVRINVTN